MKRRQQRKGKPMEVWGQGLRKRKEKREEGDGIWKEEEYSGHGS